MAKTSMINRDIKRKKLVKKFAAKRDALRDIVGSATASYEEKMEAATKLQKLPRDSSPSRVRSASPSGAGQRCWLRPGA
mgnify:CR=1 FL=1